MTTELGTAPPTRDASRPTPGWLVPTIAVIALEAGLPGANSVQDRDIRPGGPEGRTRRRGGDEMDSATSVPGIGLWRRLATFGRHFLEMCVAMCVAVALTTLALGAAAGAGLALREQAPAATYLAVAVALTLPMAAWMRFRGMAWKPILEMSGVGVLVAVAAALVGLVDAATVAVGTVCGLECVGMAADMLYRFDLYGGHAGHAPAHAHHR